MEQTWSSIRLTVLGYSAESLPLGEEAQRVVSNHEGG